MGPTKFSAKCKNLFFKTQSKCNLNENLEGNLV